MCLAIPGRIVTVATDPSEGRMARVDFGGIVRNVCLDYLPEARPGSYVLVHVGFAISQVDEEEARRTYRLLAEIGALTELSDEPTPPPVCPTFPPP